jgi:hypothetical protein
MARIKELGRDKYEIDSSSGGGKYTCEVKELQGERPHVWQRVWTCTCPGFQHVHKCKHIKELVEVHAKRHGMDPGERRYGAGGQGQGNRP